MSGKDLRVERTFADRNEIHIYDKFGSGALTVDEEGATFIRDRLNEVLEDE